MFRYIIGLIFLCFFSCKNINKEITLSAETNTDMKYLLNCDKFYFSESENTYDITVNSTRIKTNIGKEMGASISALKVYEEVVKDNTMLAYNTKFNIIFSDTNKVYSYSLQDLSDVSNGQEVIDKLIIGLQNRTVSIHNFNCKDEPKDTLNEVNIDWSKIKDYGIGGFQIFKSELCHKKRDIILYRFFIYPQKIQLWFYLDKKENKIIRIINNEGNI